MRIRYSFVCPSCIRAMHHATPLTTPATSPSSTKWKRGRPVAASSEYTTPAASQSTSHPIPRVLPAKESKSDNNGRPSVKPQSLTPDPHHIPAKSLRRPHFTSIKPGVRIPYHPIGSSIKNGEGWKTRVANGREDPSVRINNPESSNDSTSIENEDMARPTDSEYIPSQVQSEDSVEETSDQLDEGEEDEAEEHIPLSYQIPENKLRAAMSASPNTRSSYWSTKLYRGPEGQNISTHYCRDMKVAERVAQYFLEEKILGFDIEWKPNAHPKSIKQNASLIQLASEDRIALFHISLFAGTKPADLIPPTLKIILESPTILKVGVAVKSDFTRLTKYLGIQSRGVFELSRLHNLVEWHATDPNKASKKLVSLATQVQMHLQLPLYKGEQLLDDPEDMSSVRESDWSKSLNMKQIHYAAADAYAGFRLYHILEWKRKQLRPTPASPALCDGDAASTTKSGVRKKAPSAKRKEENAIDNGQVEEQAEEDEDEDAYETAPEDNTDNHEVENLKRVARVNLTYLQGPDPGYPKLPIEFNSSDDYSDSSQEFDNLSDFGQDLNELNDSETRLSIIDTGTESDEFADPELEKALQSMDLDNEGTLQERGELLSNPATHLEGHLELQEPHNSTDVSDFNLVTLDLQEPTATSASTSQSLATTNEVPRTVEYDLATRWAQTYLQSTIPPPDSEEPSRIRATVQHLRCYHMWHIQGLSLSKIARLLRDPPLASRSVKNYIFNAVVTESLDYDKQVMKTLILKEPIKYRQKKWKKIAEQVEAFR